MYLGAVSVQEAKADIFLNFRYKVYLGNTAAAKKMLRTVISAHLSNNRRHAPSKSQGKIENWNSKFSQELFSTFIFYLF